MSKIIKILLSVAIIFSLSIFFQNTVHALDDNGDGWDDPKDFHGAAVRQGVTENNIVRDRFWIWNDDNPDATPDKPDFIIKNSTTPGAYEWVDNKYPVLEETRGMLCLQHNLEQKEIQTITDKDGKVTGYVNVPHIIKNRIRTSGNGRALNNDGYVAKGNVGLISYILTYTNKNPSNRSSKGAQGALWKVIADYFDSFPGTEDQDFVDNITEANTTYHAWATTENAVAIRQCARTFNNMINSVIAPTITQKAGFQWRVDSTGSNYIIGPFSASFNDAVATYTLNNVSRATRLAGVTGVSLTNALGQSIGFQYCNSDGSGATNDIYAKKNDFYLKVPVNGLGGNYDLKLTISDQYLNAAAEFWDIKVKSNSVNYQRRIYIVSARSWYDGQSTSTSFSPSSLTVNKIDKELRTGIKGMQFKIRYNGSLWVTSLNGASAGMASYTSSEANAGILTSGDGGIMHMACVDGRYEIIEVGVGPNWQYEIPNPNVFVQDVNRNNPIKVIENVKVFVKITGYVWVDRGNDGKETSRDNVYNNGTKDRYLNNVDVRLKHKTNANFNNEGRGITATSSVRIDPDTGKYISYQFVVRRGELPNLYIEFDYDGLQYQCVTPSSAINGSKAVEVASERDTFNANFSTIEGNGNNTGYTLNSNGGRSKSLTYTKQEHKSILNNVTTTENSTTVTIGNKGNYHIQSDTTSANYQLVNPGAGVDIIQNVNFGVYERTQPDLAVVKDIQSVRLSINGKNHVYDYNQRINATNNEDTSGFNVGVKFQNSYKTKYKRAIYRSDYEYTNTDDTSKELQVYITYRIMIKNQSSLIATQPNRLYEYYDKNYELVSVGKGLEADRSNIKDKLSTSQYREDTSYNNGNYTKLIIEPDLGTIGAGQDKSVYVQFHLNRTAVIDILNGRENLDNFVEIASYSSIKDGKPYAGVDIDSNPGNASPTDESTVEDDSDVSPTLLLEVANAREMQGTVFVDEALQPEEGIDTSGVMTGKVREGDGIYNYDVPEPESTLGDVDITFTEQAEEGNKGVIYETKTVKEGGRYKFQLEYYDADKKLLEDRFERLYVDKNNLTETNKETDFSSELPAGTKIVVTPTPVDGNEESEKIYTKELQKGDFFLVGYIPGDYTLTYTWGGQEYEMKISDTETKTEKVTVQNYKGTIYSYDRYLENYVGKDGNEPNKNWYDVEPETRYTDAIDDYTTREAIDKDFMTIDYNTKRGEDYTNITKMDSTTPVMNIDVEYKYKIGETEPVEENSTEIADRYTNLVENIDFGVIRRAKQDYVIEKRISSMKITLANGRTLADLKVKVDENTGKRVLTGTKTGATYMEPSVIQSNGMLRFEMDSELIQGSQIQLTYEIVIRNTSEVDYVNKDFYKFGIEPATEADKQKDIVKISPTKVADYLDRDWAFEAIKNETHKWSVDTSKAVLSEDVIDSEGYKNTQKLFTDYGTTWKLDPVNNNEGTIDLNVSKLLSSSQDIELDNEIAIVEITKNGGGDIEEDITPGNYEPAGDGDIIINEPDDDMAETLTITPNTGENRNYTLPIIITLSAFAILIGGIIFIKKKILNK